MKNYSLIIGVLLLAASCDNNDDDIQANDRNESLYGQWEYEAIESNTAVDINGDGTVNIDLYNTNEIRQCLKDNLTFFNSRGPGEKNVFTINENGLSCGEVPAYNNVEEDRYELIDNEILRFENRADMRIIHFTKNRLVLEQDDFLDNQEVVITYTYKRS
jgi:hypothetical protein